MFPPQLVLTARDPLYLPLHPPPLMSHPPPHPHVLLHPPSFVSRITCCVLQVPSFVSLSLHPTESPRSPSFVISVLICPSSPTSRVLGFTCPPLLCPPCDSPVLSMLPNTLLCILHPPLSTFLCSCDLCSPCPKSFMSMCSVSYFPHPVSLRSVPASPHPPCRLTSARLRYPPSLVSP